MKTRPVQILALSLASLTMGDRLAASSLSNSNRHAESIAHHTANLTLQRQDGDDLETVVNRMHDYLLETGSPELGIMKVREYTQKISNEARYPAACSERLVELLVISSEGQPFTDGNGKPIGDFSGYNGRLHLVNKRAFEAENVCKPGVNETTTQSIELAQGFRSAYDRAIGANDPAVDIIAESELVARTGKNIAAYVHTMPACEADIQMAMAELDTVKKQEETLPPEVLARSRDHITKELAEKAFVSGGECGIGKFHYSGQFFGPPPSLTVPNP